MAQHGIVVERRDQKHVLIGKKILPHLETESPKRDED
jgi:hypothetical protein